MDDKKHIKKMVDLLGSVLEGTAEEGYKSIIIETETGKRSIEHMNMTEIFKLREIYLNKLNSLGNEKRKRAIIKPYFRK